LQQKQACRKLQRNSIFRQEMQAKFSKKSGRQDLNLPPENPNDILNNELQQVNNDLPAKNCPKDNICPNLKQVISAWPNLPQHIKTAIKALVQTHNKEQK
jgi:hypothetical protein